MKYTIDLKEIKDKESLHKTLAETLEFPEYYGNNLDALSDILSEKEQNTRLVFINRSSVPEDLSPYLDRLFKVLSDLEEQGTGISYAVFKEGYLPLTTVVFDIGNVLIEFTSMEFVRERFGEEMGLRIANALFGEGRWPEFDRGVLSDEEVIQSFLKADPGIPEKDIRWCIDNIARTVLPKGYAIPWIRDVKKLGYRVLFLSNYSKIVMNARPEVLNFLPLMDGGIFSCDVKLIKPDPAIYRLLTDRYELNPEQCLFIDDTGRNCDAAEALGFQSYVFRDPDTDRGRIMEIILNP